MDKEILKIFRGDFINSIQFENHVDPVDWVSVYQLFEQGWKKIGEVRLHDGIIETYQRDIDPKSI